MNCMKLTNKKLSYEEYYEKKYKKSKRVWILVLILLAATVIILGMGIAKNREREEQLRQEAQQYYTNPEAASSE